MTNDTLTFRYREITPARGAEFVAAGLRPSLFFPHCARYLPKAGPDGFKLATRMSGPVDADALWEVVLYAEAPQRDAFPPELFFDDDLVWHQQQFGLPGQIATANLVQQGSRLDSMVHISDIVQRIGRRREHKTHIENRFGGWIQMLQNAVMAFALERGASQVRMPTSGFALRHTDPARNPGKALFEKIYDRGVASLYRARSDGDWWTIDVAANRDRIVVPAARETTAMRAKTVCICHDIERGLGHVDIDPAFAAAADRTARATLDAMLAAEAAAGVKATYSIVGAILAEERARIEPSGHAVAFHSYDHAVMEDGSGEQLARCRRVDYRIKGYRAPRSRLTGETADEPLLFHNFEWLASSRYSFGFGKPKMHRRLAKIPIGFDDFPLHSQEMSYADWQQGALAEIEREPFVAFGLHDCYAAHWMPHYPRLLDRLQSLAALRTMNDVAAELALASAV